MAATSLADQLKKLTVPQTTIYKDDKKKTSLLFDPQEAALKDRDTFYDIGLSGLSELITLYEGFRFYQDTLFSSSSKDFERSVQTKEVNQNLDHTIEKFLLQLSPYLLLECAHKALEWLVNRYHIHQSNQEAIMALILPYHETKIFIRFVQLMNIKPSSNRWNWLRPIQKHGISLAKQVLYNQCASSTDTLQFIARSILNHVQEFGERASQLNTVFAFFCATAIGAINTSKRVTESMINALLPTLVKGLESAVLDFRSSAYVILGFLSTKASIKEDTLNVIIYKLLTTEFDLSYDMTLLLNLLYTNQEHMSKMSEDILSDISVDTMNVLCGHLKKLVEQKINILPFILAFLSGALPVIQSDTEEFRKFGQLPEILLDEVDLRGQQPEKIIQYIIDAFQLQGGSYITDGDESDIEIIEENDFTGKILLWYSALLKNVEVKYPEAFDKVIKKHMGSKSKTSAKRRKLLSKVLGFKPAVSHKVCGAYLFENLNHVNPELRIEAVKYIANSFEILKTADVDFLKDSIVNRLNDDDASVVNATLEISNENLKEVLNETDLTNTFVNILSRSSKHWRPVIRQAIIKFCSLDMLPVNQETVLALLPYLFPHDKKSVDVTWQILSSSWGNRFKLTKKLKGIKDAFKDNVEVLNQSLFRVLFIDRSVNFDDILNVDRLNKDKSLDVCMYLLLKSCSFKIGTAIEIIDILNLLLESVETRAIIPSSVGQSLSPQMMPEFIKCARQDKILFEIMECIFSRIIEDVNIMDISKPWCNVCETPETILIRRLYEICITGCGIASYSENYAKLLQKLLKRFFHDPKEKIEFIANFACGHILYATDPKDVISPELQLRSLKLLYDFVGAQEDTKWIYDSDVVILLVLFNLNNPVTAIRKCIIDLISTLLKNEPDKKQVNVLLLKELLSHKEELTLDHEQLPQVLNTILIHKSPGNKLFRENCLLKFARILRQDTPAYVKSSFLKILSCVNNANAFSVIISSLTTIEKVLKDNVHNSKFALDIYQSNLMKSVYGHINETTISTFNKDHVWSSIVLGLKEYRECILEEEQTFTSPSVLILKQIDEDVFKKVPEEKTKELVYLIASAGAFSNNPAISSVASKVMKKIHLRFSDFKPILEGMLNVMDPTAVTTRKKKSTISMLTNQLTETDEWRLGIALLEYVQSKKKMTVDNSLVVTLFQLLNKCLRFEEQSYVEYTKQLILSSLWYYCKKFVDDTDKDQLKSLKSLFDVEIIVQCIRGTQNPQTHHHALILLSHAAYMMPEQVLHHTMEIFTFMGSSVLSYDDAYSFQIIIKIIETLIPILVKLDKNIEECSEKEIQKLQNRVVPVLRIFADVILHVPEHRRLPLYKKLIETLGASHFLWVFLALLLETEVAKYNESKKKEARRQSRTLAHQEFPIKRIDIGQSIVLEFSPEIGLENLIKLIVYMKTLPLQKDDNCMDTDVDPCDIFSVNGHSANQLRHYKYTIVTFLSTCLASSRFIQHCDHVTDVKIMESHFKTFIVNILTFIQSISKVSDEKTVKYWRVMLHYSYELLDHTNSLLPVPMFLSVIRGLLKHTLVTVQRKAIDLLNNKIQFSPEMFDNVDKEFLYSLLPPLLDIIKTIGTNHKGMNDFAAEELELNQQIALLSLKLLTKMLASENPEPFKPVLEVVTEYICNLNIAGNIMAGIVLCLAELCGYLKAHVLTSLRIFMPALIKVWKKQRKANTPHLVLISTVSATSKIIESIPLFLSPYLQKILHEYSILLAQYQKYDQGSSDVANVLTKLSTIKATIAGSIPPRVLIPVANETHRLLLEKKNYDAIGPVMSVLADSFINVTTADFTALQQDLTGFFLTALQLRSDAVEKTVNTGVIDRAEDEVVNALVCLVLKLSENSFRPFYFKIYDWAIRTNVEGHKDRSITFYRLSSAIADKLKGLFVLFSGHFIKNAAELLDACNISKTEDLYFDSEEKCIALIKSIIKTLHVVFLYDSQNFLNKDKFETLMQPVVDQLENTLGGIPSLQTRASESLIPCISQFAVATADDSLWKLLNYQILLKIRHNDAEIRLIALNCLVAMAAQLGNSWMPLVAESIPFLAELLEDGDSRIEAATKDAVRKLEQSIGESLEKYF